MEPILKRLDARNIRQVDGDVFASLPVIDSDMLVEYGIMLEGNIITYYRKQDNKGNNIKLDEVDRINHYLAPLYERTLVQSSVFSEVSSSDIMVRLHLLLPGDSFISTSRVLYLGAGVQKSSDVYMVK